MKNNKFLKISIILVIVLSVFIVTNKVLFKDMVHEDDYINNNQNKVEITYDSRFKTEEGTFIKLKVDNKSKFIYRIQDMYIDIPSVIKYEDGSETWTSMLRLNMFDGKENEIWDLVRRGIKPSSKSYVDFLIPKGIVLDEKYFDLNDLQIMCNGSFTVNLPFSQDAYITVRSGGESHTIEGNIKDLLTDK